MDLDDPKIDWQIPNQETFEKVMDLAICEFTEEDPDRLEVIEFSKVGWNTGVGLVGFRTDNMNLVGEFASIVKGLEILEHNLRFCLAPRKLLMDKYVLTCYFNSSFKMQKPKNLIYWILKFNPTLKGKADLVEVREYPASHENTKRAGAKIIAFEGDQVFLDSLYLHHKDYPFTIRFGGNLYIRGGERISPDDPTGVPPRRPRLSRDAAKQLISGSGKAILDDGISSEEAAAKKALDEAKKQDAEQAKHA